MEAELLTHPKESFLRRLQGALAWAAPALIVVACSTFTTFSLLALLLEATVSLRTLAILFLPTIAAAALWSRRQRAFAVAVFAGQAFAARGMNSPTISAATLTIPTVLLPWLQNRLRARVLLRPISILELATWGLGAWILLFFVGADGLILVLVAFVIRSRDLVHALRARSFSQWLWPVALAVAAVIVNQASPRSMEQKKDAEAYRPSCLDPTSARASGVVVDFAALGNSTTWGMACEESEIWTTQLAARLNQANVSGRAWREANCAREGASLDVMPAQLERASSFSPRIVFMSPSAAGHEIDRFRATVEHLIDINDQAGRVTVLLTYATGSLSRPDTSNEVIRAIGRERGVVVVDLAREIGRNQALFTADRVHYNALGHSTVADILAREVPWCRLIPGRCEPARIHRERRP